MKTPPASVLIRKAHRHREGQRHAQHHQGRQDHAQAARRDRQDQAAGSHGRRSGCRRAHHRGQRAQHGRGSGGRVSMSIAKREKAWHDEARARQAISGGRSGEAGQGIRHREVQRGGRRRGESRHRCEQVGPAGARLDGDAARHRQDRARRGVHLRQERGAAKAAGADIVGLEDLAAKVKAGEINFDCVIASPDAMRVVGQLGQILGPRGLMPNPKVGTVTPDVATAVKNAKSGQVHYRVDKAGIVHCTIGKASFEAERAEGEPAGADRGPAEGKARGVQGHVSEARHAVLDHGARRGGRSSELGLIADGSMWSSLCGLAS